MKISGPRNAAVKTESLCTTEQQFFPKEQLITVTAMKISGINTAALPAPTQVKRKISNRTIA